ncbi:MAG: alpha/beta hydrolase-fold protein [Promethearchaeota archaeon]
MSNLGLKSQILSPMILNFREEIKIDKKTAISKFWKKIEEIGTPIFEDIEGDNKYNLITFVFREDEEIENIVCYIRIYLQNMFLTQDIKECILERIKGTNVYFKSYKILKGIRATYILSKNNPLEPKNPQENWVKYLDTIVLDPFNSKKSISKIKGISIPIHEIESPEAPPQPWYGNRINIDHGKVEEFTSYSEVLENERQILVYTPPNYSKKHIPYYFLLLFDGILYEENAKVSSTLDNLIADDKIPPIVATMVENYGSSNPNLRNNELSANPRFVEYIIKELLPWVRENFNITTSPSQSVVAGTSAGAIMSTFIAFKHPEIFGNVISTSGSYWKLGEEFANQFAQNKLLPLKFYIDVGVLEAASPSGIFNANRHFHTVLLEKGYPVCYTEFLGGHDFVCFRGSIAEGLIYLVGK